MEKQQLAEIRQVELAYKAELDEVIKAQGAERKAREKIDSKLRSTSAQHKADLERITKEKRQTEAEKKEYELKLSEREKELKKVQQISKVMAQESNTKEKELSYYKMMA
jgi:hypothetical protein